MEEILQICWNRLTPNSKEASHEGQPTGPGDVTWTWPRAQEGPMSQKTSLILSCFPGFPAGGIVCQL